MTSAITSFGTSLKRNGSTLAEVVSVDAPDYTQPAVEATNHSSSGVREFVSGMLAEMSEFKATLNLLSASITTLVGDLTAGSVIAYSIVFPDTTAQTFSAIVTGIKPLAADAQNPDALKMEVTFRPTGTLGLS